MAKGIWSPAARSAFTRCGHSFAIVNSHEQGLLATEANFRCSPVVRYASIIELHAGCWGVSRSRCFARCRAIVVMRPIPYRCGLVGVSLALRAEAIVSATRGCVFLRTVS